MVAMGGLSPFSLYTLDRDLTREQLIAALADTPGRVQQLLAGQTDHALNRRDTDAGWSPIEIVRHVRDAVQVYGMRFKWMILQDDPFLPSFDENRWSANSPDGPSEVSSVVGEVEAYRSETVRLLRALSPDGWSRRGRHEVLGAVELEPYVRHQLAHEEQHLDQLRDALRTA